MSSIDHGAHIITLTNMIAPDIFTPGNHEFDFGKEVFLRRMSEATFPLYAANLRAPDGNLLPGFKDNTMVTVNGVRIGIAAATYDRSPTASSPGDLKFESTITTMKQQGVELKRQGADFVVMVMHAAREQTLELFAADAADFFLTGHTHDLYISFDGRNAIVESSHDAHYVVVIDVSIEVTTREGRREVAWWPQFRVIDTATVTPDPEVAAVVQGFEDELGREMNVAIATTTIELDSRIATVRTREAAIGDLIADAMRDKTRADAAIMNGGGIRGDTIYPPGTAITRRDVLTQLPFGNTVVTLDIAGSELRAAVENGLSRLPQPAGRFPQVSGMKVEYDPRRPPGNRVVSMQVAGAPLDPNRTYRLVTNDYMARGGDGYVQFEHLKPLLPPDDSPTLANEVMVYLRRLGTVGAGLGGRLVVAP
jgi:2',3'-cyclic-nucleotide 2'-phosphodiesterase (5'-nucleotidase family)